MDLRRPREPPNNLVDQEAEVPQGIIGCLGDFAKANPIRPDGSGGFEFDHSDPSNATGLDQFAPPALHALFSFEK